MSSHTIATDDHARTPGSPSGQKASPSERSIRRRLTTVAALTALGGLLFGYDTGVISGALLFIKKDFHFFSAFDKELVTSLLLVGAMVGAVGAGKVADRIGRRPTVLVTAVIFIVSVLGAAFSPAFAWLVLMRFVIGLAVGSASVVVPLYISEMAPPRLRGALVSLNQLAITVGILVSFLVDYGLSSSENWRLMFGLAAIPAALLLVGAIVHSESPHWLVTKGRESQARALLTKLRYGSDIDAEVGEVRELSRQRAGLRDVWGPKVRPALVLGVALAVFQQITGINTVIYYAPTLLKGAGLGSSAALLANVMVGVVNVGMTIVAIWLLDRTGRRPLLLWGTVGMAIGLIVEALTFAGGDSLTGSAAIVAVAALIFYTGSFAIGLGPVFWLLISEIYPLKVRGQAMSVASMANWGANFVVTVSFLTILGAIGGFGTFLAFGIVTVAALAYFRRFVPETKGRSLQEIERELRSAKVSTPSRPLVGAVR